MCGGGGAAKAMARESRRAREEAQRQAQRDREERQKAEQRRLAEIEAARKREEALAKTQGGAAREVESTLDTKGVATKKTKKKKGSDLRIAMTKPNTGGSYGGGQNTPMV